MDSKDSNQFLEEQKVLADAIAGLKEVVRTMKLTIIENETEQKMKSRQFCDEAIGKNWTTFWTTFDGSVYHDGNGKLYRVNVTDEGEFDFTPWSYFGSRLTNDSHSEVDNGEEDSQPCGGLVNNEEEKIYLAIAYGRDILEANLNYLKLFPESYVPSWSQAFAKSWESQVLPREHSCDAAVVSIFCVDEKVNVDAAIDLVDKRTERYSVSGGLICGFEAGDYLDSDLSIDREIKRWFWGDSNFEVVPPTQTPLVTKIQDYTQHLAVRLAENLK